MGIRLEEAMHNSNKGYIDRADDIREIMEHITALTLKELRNHSRNSHLQLFEVWLEEKNIPTSYLNDLRYTEMLGLVDSIKIDYIFGMNEEDARCRLQYISTIIDTLQKASVSCGWVRLFLSVSVKAYMDFLAERADDEQSYERYNNLHEMVKNTLRQRLKEATTIGELIKRADAQLKKPLDPLQFIGDYAEQIYYTYEIIDTLLVTSMRKAYPTQFSIEQIKHNAATLENAEQQTEIELSLQ